MKPRQLTLEENEKLANFICPDCGWDLLIFGPRGGLSRNTLCGNCKTEFNRSSLISERIAQPCDPQRQAEVYQMDRFPVDKFPLGKPWREADLQKLNHCSDHNCKREHPLDELEEIFMRSACHPACPVINAAYLRTENIFVLRCGECRRPILKIAVAE